MKYHPPCECGKTYEQRKRQESNPVGTAWKVKAMTTHLHASISTVYEPPTQNL
ncbi:MAG: hypothetical protein HYZ57_15270 [Acidobacteria bacterium]|nr:hypothetical protein [Acidobacteriota bacterium]